jgi:hypothetical protein
VATVSDSSTPARPAYNTAGGSGSVMGVPEE